MYAHQYEDTASQCPNALRCPAGYTYAAGLNAMRGATRMLGAPPGSSFEVFGVDMLVDTAFRPWLVEINAVPSLARKVGVAQERAEGAVMYLTETVQMCSSWGSKPSCETTLTQVL